MMRFLAWLSAVFWIGLGIVFLLRMPQMAEGLAFTSPDGLTGLRAIVSGLHIAIGTVILVFCLNRLTCWEYSCRHALRAGLRLSDCLEWSRITRLLLRRFATWSRRCLDCSSQSRSCPA